MGLSGTRAVGGVAATPLAARGGAAGVDVSMAVVEGQPGLLP